MKKRILLMCIGTIFASLTLSACVYESEFVPVDTEIPSMQTNIETGKVETSQILDVYGEDFKLVCDYDTGRYDLSKWRVTDSKSVGMTVHTENLPDGYEVYIDHVHADISLKGTTPQADGIIQDSMDDTCHAYSQDGFYINNNTSYYNIFAIEGYTEQFYTLWGYACGDYGSVSSSYKRMTESNIVKAGTYAEKLRVVYDLSIKAPDEPHFHTVSVLSEILIPVNQDTSEITVTRDLLTNEIFESTETEQPTE